MVKKMSWPSGSAEYLDRFGSYDSLRNRVLKTYFSRYHRLTVEGRDNIPDGPGLIYANHGGGFDLDTLALSHAGVTDRPIQVMIDESWHYITRRRISGTEETACFRSFRALCA